MTRLFALLPRLRSFGAGAVSVLAFAPFGWWFILPLVFAILWHDIMRAAAEDQPKPLRGVFLTLWFFGLGHFMVGLLWMNEALLVDAAAHAWLIPFSMTLIPGFLALFLAVPGALAWRLTHAVKAETSPASTLAFLLALAGALSAGEWLRGHILTGFPWNLWATVWIDLLPVAQVSALIGPYGLGLLTLFWGLAGGWLLWQLVVMRRGFALRQAALYPFILSSLFLTASGIWGLQRIATLDDLPESDIAYRIIQPNIAQAEKWQRDKRFDHIVKAASLGWPLPDERPADKELLIWPETAVPFLWAPGDRVDQYMASLPRPGQILLSGIIRMDTDEGGSRRFYNSLARWQDGASTIVYDKKHLVPFGEYVPFGDLLRHIGLGPITRGSYTEGDGPDVVAVGHGLKALPLICYEAIFPGAVAAKAHEADFLLNITNDGWFGTSAGPWQHAAAVRFRAIETGRTILRAANTGISMVVKPNGKISQYASLHEEKSIIGRFSSNPGSVTAYMRFGDFIYAALLLIFLLVSIIYHRLRSSYSC